MGNVLLNKTNRIEKSYKEFIGLFNMKDNKISYDRYMNYGGSNWRREVILQDISLYLCSIIEGLEEQDGLAITNTETNEFLALYGEDLKFEETLEGLYIWDKENSITLRINNNSTLKELKDCGADDLLLNGKYKLGYL